MNKNRFSKPKSAGCVKSLIDMFFCLVSITKQSPFTILKKATNINKQEIQHVVIIRT